MIPAVARLIHSTNQQSKECCRIAPSDGLLPILTLCHNKRFLPLILAASAGMPPARLPAWKLSEAASQNRQSHQPAGLSSQVILAPPYALLLGNTVQLNSLVGLGGQRQAHALGALRRHEHGEA